jgi:hypothetical protein
MKLLILMTACGGKRKTTWFTLRFTEREAKATYNDVCAQDYFSFVTYGVKNYILIVEDDHEFMNRIVY